MVAEIVAVHPDWTAEQVRQAAAAHDRVERGLLPRSPLRYRDDVTLHLIAASG
jgi:hypothetical protein